MQWREKAEVEGSSVAAAEFEDNAASKEEEEVIGRMEEGTAHMAEGRRGCGMVEEEIVAGSSSRGRVVYSHCTLAPLEDIVDFGC